MWTVNRLRAELGLQTDPGAREEEISQAESRLGITLPVSLRALYVACNGARHPSQNFSLMPLVEACDLLLSFADQPPWQPFGLGRVDIRLVRAGRFGLDRSAADFSF